MSKKWISYIVPVTTTIFLSVLFLGYILRLNNATALIGVILAPFPSDTSISSMVDGSFQAEFGEWLSDNFLGHTYIVKCHNQLEYGVFDDGIGEWIQGKEGYVFSREESYSYVAGERANSTSWEEYLSYAQSVAEMQNMLSKYGKDFVYLLTPVKAEVYPDYLPWYMQLLYEEYADDENSQRNMLVRAFEKCGVNYYDVTDDLKAMRKNVDFDTFSKTGHHWTLTAAALEMGTMLEKFGEMSEFTEYPSVKVIGINDNFFDTDKDILNLQNVIFPKLADSYNSPDIEIVPTSDSAYIFGTSFGWEVASSLYKNAADRAFDKLIFEEYFTTKVVYDAGGAVLTSYTVNDTPDDIGVMSCINQSSLVIMEQNGSRGILDTHKKFVNYVLESLNSGYFSITGSLLGNTDDKSRVELQNFYRLEDWGRWTQGNDCSVIIHDPLKSNSTVYLKARAYTFATNQEVEVSLNGSIIDTISVTQEYQDYMIELPKEIIQSEDNVIAFKLLNETTSPKKLNIADDDRVLGLGFSELSIVVGGEQ